MIIITTASMEMMRAVVASITALIPTLLAMIATIRIIIPRDNSQHATK